jgi:hypothetical protein
VSADKAIMVQVAGKIAGELVSSMQLRTTADVMDSFNEVFVRVLTAMDTTINAKETKTTKGGRQIPVLSQDEIQLRLNQKLQSGSAVTTSSIKSF